ncbi:BON domain-containing protein [Limnohabitans sp.]|uniref:BON domain-containing protein n=1 Tax=Limnohabitans sp. TaxID=1907725 RepID=UPI0038BC49CE
MKFPKSVHAEGWAHHFDADATPPATRAAAPRRAGGPKAGAKPVRAHTLLNGEPEGAFAQRIAALTPPPVEAAASAHGAGTPVVTPWVVGAGIGVAMIASVVLMARSMPPMEHPAPVIVGQVAAPEPAGQAMPLPMEPTGAGPVQPPAEAAPAIAEATPAAQPVPAESRVAPAVPAVRSLQPAEMLARAAALPLVPMPEPAPAPEAPVAVPQAAAMQASPPLAALAPATEAGDAGITVQVRQALASDAALAALPIAVSTAHGVVRLEGQAPDAQTREHATVVASAAEGVKGVDNRLTLPPTA